MVVHTFISALRRQRPVCLQEFKTILVYTVSTMTVKATEKDPVSKKKTGNQGGKQQRKILDADSLFPHTSIHKLTPHTLIHTHTHSRTHTRCTTHARIHVCPSPACDGLCILDACTQVNQATKGQPSHHPRLLKSNHGRFESVVPTPQRWRGLLNPLTQKTLLGLTRSIP